LSGVDQEGPPHIFLGEKRTASSAGEAETHTFFIFKWDPL